MGVLKWLLGPEEEREPTSQTRFSDVDLETALSEAERLHARAEDTIHGSTANYLMQKATYHELVGVAKRIGLPVDNPMIMESNALYARAEDTSHGHTANYLMGKANHKLAKVIEHHLRDGLPKTPSK